MGVFQKTGRTGQNCSLLEAQQGIFQQKISRLLAQPDAQHHAEKLSVADRRALNVLADEKTGAFSGHKFHGKAVASLVEGFSGWGFCSRARR